MSKLESEILEIIDTTINGHYIGSFKVLVEDNLYTLMIHMNQEQAPLLLCKEGTEEEFKNFIRDEFRTRKMEKVSYWKAIQELPTSEPDDEINYDRITI